MSLNLVVPTLAYLKIEWFHCTKFQKSSGSIVSFSKVEWFLGTTGTTSNAGLEICQNFDDLLLSGMIHIIPLCKVLINGSMGLDDKKGCCRWRSV